MAQNPDDLSNEYDFLHSVYVAVVMLTLRNNWFGRIVYEDRTFPNPIVVRIWLGAGYCRSVLSLTGIKFGSVTASIFIKAKS